LIFHVLLDDCQGAPPIVLTVWVRPLSVAAARLASLGRIFALYSPL